MPPFFNAVDGNLFIIGDSISVGATDEVTGVGYPVLLNAAIAATTKGYWTETTPRGSHGGYDILNVDSQIAADLAATSLTPTHVLILIGANDVSTDHWPLFTEATWKAAYQSVIDKVHAKWVNAKIHLGNSYRQNEPNVSRLITLSGWIATLIAANPGVCFAGINTMPIFMGNEATLLIDDVHPNHAGFVAMVAPWKTALGYA